MKIEIIFRNRKLSSENVGKITAYRIVDLKDSMDMAESQDKADENVVLKGSSIAVSEGSEMHTMVDSMEPAILRRRTGCLMDDSTGKKLAAFKMLKAMVLKKNSVV